MLMSSSVEIPELGASLEKAEEEEEFCSTLQVPFDEVYSIEEILNLGSLGTVYKARYVPDPDEQTFAVKVMERDYSRYEKRALREVSILRELRNVPNVIKLIDFYMDDNYLYSVQMLAAGGDVFDRLAQNEIYTEENARDLAQILVRTVDDMHNLGVVHRDIKPENILLRDKRRDAEILLCDFDLARQLKGDESRMSTWCGTAAYMAPEILQHIEYGKKVDVWSTGCVLYFLLGGYLPFGQEATPGLFHRAVNGYYDFEDPCWDVVSEAAKDLIWSMLQVDPNERWSTEQILECDWFTKCKAATLRNSDLEGTLKKFQNYCARRKLKGAVHAVEFSNSLTRGLGGQQPKQEAQTEEKSKNDADAIMTKKEFQNFCAKQKVKGAVYAIAFSNSLKCCNFSENDETQRTMTETEIMGHDEVELDSSLNWP